MLREPAALRTTDDLTLEAELVAPEDPWAGAILLHPNSRDGGNMRSFVPGELIKALPEIGVATLRFNFRGVGASEGEMEDGVGERLDTVAAIDTMHDIVEGLPLVLFGSSFGANTSLTVDDERISAWCACAPTLPDGLLTSMALVGADPRPKHLVLAERDSYRLPADIRALTEAWANTTSVVVPGADHFFVGRMHLVVDACTTFVRSLHPAP